MFWVAGPANLILRVEEECETADTAVEPPVPMSTTRVSSEDTI